MWKSVKECERVWKSVKETTVNRRRCSEQKERNSVGVRCVEHERTKERGCSCRHPPSRKTSNFTIISSIVLCTSKGVLVWMLLGVPVVLFSLNFTSWLSKLTALFPRLFVKDHNCQQIIKLSAMKRNSTINKIANTQNCPQYNCQEQCNIHGPLFQQHSADVSQHG